MQRARLSGGGPTWWAVSLVYTVFLMTFTARAAAPDAAPVAIVLHSEGAELTLEALQRALIAELALPVVPADAPESASKRGVLTVTYRPQTKELVVSYSDAARGTVTRVVPAPDRAVEVADIAALVAGNLIRDQTAELLAAGVADSLTLPRPELAPVAPAPPSPSEMPPPDPPAPATHWLGNASVFYPLATNAKHPELTTHFDINLLYGHIGALNGLEVGTVSTVSGDAQGLQASLLTNLVGGQVRAGQFSFVFNRGHRVEGVQVALMNRADHAMQGLQLGGLNLAGSLSKGLQLSGVNVAGNVEGVQIGIVNVGKRVRGMQIGLVNVSDEVEGVPIGLISVSKTGGVHPVAWSSNTTFVNVGVKFAARHSYTMVSGAMHYDGEHTLYGAGLTIGASIPIAKKIATEIDVQALHLFADARYVCRPAAATGSGAPYTLPRAEGETATDDGFGNGYPANANTSATSCTPGLHGHAYYPQPAVIDESPTSASSRAYDQSLAKLRALLRFELYPHLSLFVGTGVTGQVTYPVRGGDTVVNFRLLSEFFGGVQL